jgi:hypothetical protein
LQARSSVSLTLRLLVAAYSIGLYFRQAPSHICWNVFPCDGEILNFAPAYTVSWMLKASIGRTCLLDGVHEVKQLLVLPLRHTSWQPDRRETRDVHVDHVVGVGDGLPRLRDRLIAGLTFQPWGLARWVERLDEMNTRLCGKRQTYLARSFSCCSAYARFRSSQKRRCFCCLLEAQLGREVDASKAALAATWCEA